MNSSSLDKALSLFSDSDLFESQRLVHGRGRCYKGLEQLSVDWFSPVILITQYKKVEHLDLDKLLSNLKSYFNKNFQTHQIDSIVFHDRTQNKLEVKLLEGEFPENCFALEKLGNKELRFQLDFNYQNIGFFLDARHARHYLFSQAKDKKILNLFSFTCAFSVSALAGGASSVVNLDMGKGVLERGKHNHEINELNGRSASFIKSDIFKAWKKLHKYGRYEVIVIDPPSFQKGSFNAEKDYPRIVSQLGKLLASEAIIIACLNSPFLGEDFLDKNFLQGPLSKGEHQCSKEQRLPNPEAFKDESHDAGLKVVVYRYRRLSTPLTDVLA